MQLHITCFVKYLGVFLILWDPFSRILHEKAHPVQFFFKILQDLQNFGVERSRKGI
jgi:hypothetical protein